jgi:hypothetical protein
MQAKITNSSLKEGGYLPPNYDPAIALWKQERPCGFCGATIVPRNPQEGRKKFCNASCNARWQKTQPDIVARQGKKDHQPRIRNCEWCKSEFKVGPGETYKRFCSRKCSSTWRMTQPEIRAKVHNAEVSAKCGAGIKAWYKSDSPSAIAAKKRIAALNPMSNPSSVAKMTASLKGKPFLNRGGNGKLTVPQTELARVLGNVPMEFAIETASVAHLLSDLPNSYKSDIAIPDRMIAIEVDGKTHMRKQTRIQDAKKTEALNALGWTVLRFWNWEILDWISSGMPTDASISTTLAQHGILPIL